MSDSVADEKTTERPICLDEIVHFFPEPLVIRREALPLRLISGRGQQETYKVDMDPFVIPNFIRNLRVICRGAQEINLEMGGNLFSFEKTQEVDPMSGDVWLLKVFRGTREYSPSWLPWKTSLFSEKRFQIEWTPRGESDETGSEVYYPGSPVFAFENITPQLPLRVMHKDPVEEKHKTHPEFWAGIDRMNRRKILNGHPIPIRNGNNHIEAVYYDGSVGVMFGGFKVKALSGQRELFIEGKPPVKTERDCSRKSMTVYSQQIEAIVKDLVMTGLCEPHLGLIGLTDPPNAQLVFKVENQTAVFEHLIKHYPGSSNTAPAFLETRNYPTEEEIREYRIERGKIFDTFVKMRNEDRKTTITYADD